MSNPIRSITIEGFKSIRSLKAFDLRKINILIGANGAGKSNFVDFFRFLREMVEGRLQFTVKQRGGADLHLYLGPQMTRQIVGRVYFAADGYAFCLEPTVNNELIFRSESIVVGDDVNLRSLGSGHEESKLKEAAEKGDAGDAAHHLYPAVSSLLVYHFHDTSDTAKMRRSHTARDNDYLRPDAANLASFLWRLSEKHADTYGLIRDTVRLVTPFFDDFLLRPQAVNGDAFLQLEWLQKGSDYPFHPSQLSDGTLRFMALATALLQPNPPPTILLDEPELGLHPFALDVLSGLIQQASARTQLIVSTQSAVLLNAFSPEDIIIVDRAEGESRFRRLTEEELSVWLEAEYTLGELWQKNVMGGTPAYE
jgi:predicted ATPase